MWLTIIEPLILLASVTSNDRCPTIKLDRAVLPNSPKRVFGEKSLSIVISLLSAPRGHQSAPFIKFADLAEGKGRRQLHGRHLVKQSIGITPHQYLIQLADRAGQAVLEREEKGDR